MQLELPLPEEGKRAGGGRRETADQKAHIIDGKRPVLPLGCKAAGVLVRTWMKNNKSWGVTAERFFTLHSVPKLFHSSHKPDRRLDLWSTSFACIAWWQRTGNFARLGLRLLLPPQRPLDVSALSTGEETI